MPHVSRGLLRESDRKAVPDIRKLKPYIKDFFKRADIFLLAVCVISSIFGIIMIERAVTGMYEGGWNMSAPSRYLAVQIASMILGLIAYVLFTVIDVDLIAQQWKALLLVDLILLVALVLIYAAISILGLLFGDILMAILDPRISFTKKEGAR